MKYKRFINKINEKYGYDFTSYNKSTIQRRIGQFMENMKITDSDKLLEMVLKDRKLFSELLSYLSIYVSSMFRDPKVFRFLREHIFPKLATYPHIRIWSAGVASGEEAYSLAVILTEMGLYDRSLIYATDFNPVILQKASKGVYPMKKLSEYTTNYIEAGGREEFSKYYATSSKFAHIDPKLKENIVFSTYNLVSDRVFNEFHLILCRNVFIFFEDSLIEKALTLFDQSLCERGYLCIGSSENIKYFKISRFFETIENDYKVYRKR